MSQQEEEKTILDKAKDLAFEIKDKVTTYVGENEEKIHGAVEKTGEFIDDKTKGKFSEKIDKAQDAAKNAVTKIGSAGSADDPTPGATPADPADVPTPAAQPDPDAPAPE